MLQSHSHQTNGIFLFFKDFFLSVEFFTLLIYHFTVGAESQSACVFNSWWQQKIIIFF